MPQMFVELYRYRSAWTDLSASERQAFSEGVLLALTEIEAAGVEVIGWAVNDRETDRRADYDFFCVYRVPSVEFQREFEKNIIASGWHDLFDQVAVSGLEASPADILSKNIALDRP